MDLSFLWKLRYDTPLGRLVRLPLKAIPKGRPVPILQGPLRGKKWIFGAGPSMFWLGSYEHPKQRRLASLLSPGHVFYDVGAHMGYYTLLGAELVGPRGRVVAFEPNPENLDYLRRHVAINAYDNVEVRGEAVAGDVGELRFDASGDSFTGRLAAGGSLAVTVTTLDRAHAEGAPLPAVVKIDVEGAELDVLHGAEAVIAAAHPVLLVATHSAELHRDCAQFLQARGYRIEPLRDRRSRVIADELIGWP